MGIGVRVFIFDNEKLIKIPFTKFDRLLDGDTDERIPEFAGQRIKVALVYVELEDRKPVSILKIDGEYISLDSKGQFDKKELEEKQQYASKMLRLPAAKDTPSNVIDSSAHFAQKTYRNKFLWTPKIKDIQKLENVIFKS